jgi:isoprenylcysteine carboxyl methyltransferase (ICMT) family protein YpbQ
MVPIEKIKCLLDETWSRFSVVGIALPGKMHSTERLRQVRQEGDFEYGIKKTKSQLLAIVHLAFIKSMRYTRV